MKRLVAPEWLDELSPDTPAAIGSRRDLRRLNWLMGNASWLAGLLRDRPFRSASPEMVELGAGDGTFALQLARRLAPVWDRPRLILVDRHPAVLSEETRAGFEDVNWRVEVVTADVFDWLAAQPAKPFDLMFANLFLHHFAGARLADLLRLAAQKTDLLAACEPRRGRRAFACSRLVGFIGCNRVTRHDAPASVRAGFRDRELSRAWPVATGWRLRESDAGLFTHTFCAARIKDGAHVRSETH